MKSVSFTAYPRTQARRGGVKKLRALGRVPAVIYGRMAQPQNLEVPAKAMEDLIHHSVSENILLDLSVDQDPRPRRLAILQEVQHHPLSGKVLHVDLHEVAENEKVTIAVPVEAVGEAAGVKLGGVLEHVLFKIRVRALPKDLPEIIHVDVSHLEIAKSLHLGEIKAPEGTEILGDKHLTVFSVAVPVSEAEETAEAEAAAGTPGEVEMIKEKKDEEGEGGEKAPAKPGEKAPAKGAEKAPAAAGGADKAAAKPAEKKK